MTKEQLSKRISRTKTYQPVGRINCKDGFHVSVQAGNGIYSDPRLDGQSQYAEVELGFPSEQIPELSEYAEKEDHKETVFGYVPIDLVVDLINKHGGEEE